MPKSRPLVGVSADRRELAPHMFHVAGEKYLVAVRDLAGATPVILPAFAPGDDLGELLDHLDGLLLTGSYSNVEPRHYGGAPSAPGTWHDPARDALTLPLIPAALAAGVPLLAICRGFQEMNVALGGSLHQAVHEVPGLADHREDKDQPLEVQYGPAHEVEVVAGGLLARLTGLERFAVNSLHTQGVDRLAQGVRIEARAPDGIIEGFVAESAPAFNLAVQWHPEWRAADNAVSRAIFGAFGAACAERARNRSQQ
jgi:putative glutamine amidotransferase